MPSASCVHTRSTWFSRVSGCFTEVTQQIHSLRASGVMSSHAARASGDASSALRRSAGIGCRAPADNLFLLIDRSCGAATRDGANYPLMTDALACHPGEGRDPVASLLVEHRKGWIHTGLGLQKGAPRQETAAMGDAGDGVAKENAASMKQKRARHQPQGWIGRARTCIVERKPGGGQGKHCIDRCRSLDVAAICWSTAGFRAMRTAITPQRPRKKPHRCGFLLEKSRVEALRRFRQRQRCRRQLRRSTR